MKFLEAKYGAALEYMRAMKKAFYPLNIINLGKIVSSKPSVLVCAVLASVNAKARPWISMASVALSMSPVKLFASKNNS